MPREDKSKYTDQERKAEPRKSIPRGKKKAAATRKHNATHESH
jgi:hypothetical protein